MRAMPNRFLLSGVLSALCLACATSPPPSVQAAPAATVAPATSPSTRAEILELSPADSKFLTRLAATRCGCSGFGGVVGRIGESGVYLWV